ncbi:phosphotransferase family protein [Amycolatopsis thermoflava]|uniref:phosphotransferase family protein n=1 Tax=Amycolatopsis thermoflava TaxID=84480 RepID=UPI003D71A350
MSREDTSRAVLGQAAHLAGLDASGATLIRLGENDLWRLPGGVVARIARAGQDAAAAKEVAVAHWLEDCGVDAVRVIRDINQPVHADGRPVTFWHELPPHEQGTVADVAAALRQVHKLEPPTGFTLPELAPFVRLAERIDRATTLTGTDRAWLAQHLAALQDRYADLPAGLPPGVVHGDAWRGNIARTANGRVVLLDFERTAIGPPEWDLVSTGVSRVTTAWLPEAEWTAYCSAYGHDVTTWPGFEVLRDIRELRMTLMACQLAVENPRYQEQAAHRLACIRGDRGPRPWAGWAAVP